MTTKDFTIKWLAYGLALAPVWFLECYLLSCLRVWGVKPMLLPLAAVAVAVLEGAGAGAGFGLAVGVLWDTVTPLPPGLAILLLTLGGLGAGLLAQYALRQDLLGCFLCSAMVLAGVDAVRVALRLLLRQDGTLAAMLSLAGREIAWSLCFVPVVYWIFHWVFQRVPKPTVL